MKLTAFVVGEAEPLLSMEVGELLEALAEEHAGGALRDALDAKRPIIVYAMVGERPNTKTVSCVIK